MRTPILTLSILILFSSCRYQYFTVASDDTPTNEKKEFVTETDSLRIIYNFNGPKGPVQISIYNKLNEGLVIDWKKSALVIGENPSIYYSPNLTINGVLRRNTWNTALDRSSTISATVSRDEATEFLPPRSKIIQSGFFLVNKNIDITSLPLTEEKIKLGPQSQKIKKGNFSKANSPLVFRSYLTFAAGNDESRIFTISNSFYVSQMIDSSTDMIYYELYNSSSGNQFFIQ